MADDPELLRLMAEAADTVFAGIEPQRLCLTECGKVANKGRDLVESVKRFNALVCRCRGDLSVRLIMMSDFDIPATA